MLSNTRGTPLAVPLGSGVRVGLGSLASAKSLRRNSAAQRLERLGYERDIGFCLAEDTVPVVPSLEGGAFVGRR